MSKKSALLVIDVQNGLIAGDEPAYRSTEVLANIQTLLFKARAAGTLVIYIQHEGDEGSILEVGSPGWHVHPSIVPETDELTLSKRASDSFYQTPLKDILDSHNIQDLVITGCKTEYCVDTTSRRATSLGYDVTLVADAHTTTDSDLLKSEQVVPYHNNILDDFGNDEHVIVVKKTAEITF
ncbi:MAG: cysteine hydrolase family protein [Ktedonobacteraceae bacterium]